MKQLLLALLVSMLTSLQAWTQPNLAWEHHTPKENYVRAGWSDEYKLNFTDAQGHPVSMEVSFGKNKFGKAKFGAYAEASGEVLWSFIDDGLGVLGYGPCDLWLLFQQKALAIPGLPEQAKGFVLEMICGPEPEDDDADKTILH